MTKKRAVPEVRFKGFEGEWEERMLGELSDVFDGTHQTPIYTASGVMFLSVENIRTLKSEKYISKEDFEKEFKVFPEKKDVLVTRIGDIGTANVVETSEPKAYYVTLALIKYKMLDPYFLKESFSSQTVIKDLWRRTLHVAFPKKINKNEIESVHIPHPITSKEQTRIGELFRNLDARITLEQRKHTKLQNIKKSMLEKMFPKPGATVPEVRFKGFSDEWETEKFPEIFTYIPNNTLSRACLNYSGGLAKNIHYGDILIKYAELLDVQKHVIPYISNDRDANKLMLSALQDGDIIIADAAEDETVGKCTEIVNIGNETIVSGLHTIPCRPKLFFSSGYIGYFMNSYSYRKQLMHLMQGAKVKSLSKSSLHSTAIFYPNDKYNTEQTRIGEFFRNLDSLIALQQRKCEKLQNIKKAMLGKMFV